MLIKYLVLGFAAKIVLGIDDAMTHIPLVSTIARRKFSRLAFTLGFFSAVILSILTAELLATLMRKVLYYHYILAGLLVLLALLIYFDVIVTKRAKTVESKVKKLKPLTMKRLFAVFGIGFITSVATILDDTIVFSSLFTAGFTHSLFASMGILIAALIEIAIIIYAAKFVSKLPYKKEIVTLSLIGFAALIAFGII